MEGQEKKSPNVEKFKEPHEFELIDRDCPICPWCGCEAEEWWDGWPSTSDEEILTCEQCGRDFVATMIQKFDSRKPRGDEDERS